MDARLYKVTEAARALNVSVDTLRRWIDAKLIDYVDLSRNSRNRSIRFTEEQMREMIERHTVKKRDGA